MNSEKRKIMEDVSLGSFAGNKSTEKRLLKIIAKR
jgi:hypothetical protein